MCEGLFCYENLCGIHIVVTQELMWRFDTCKAAVYYVSSTSSTIDDCLCLRLVGHGK
ncbi:unnamed protein product, partial [Ilex paraguariensis]